MTNIKKAVITAAGRGTRFLPVVKSFPKELVPILAKPNIQYLVEEAIGAGITEICIVHRLNENAIEKYFSPDPELDAYLQSTGKTVYLEGLKDIMSKVKFTFVAQDPDLPYGNGSPVLAAEKFIGTDPFVYMFGDDLTVEPVPGQFLSQMIAAFEKYNPAAVVSTQVVPDSEVSRYGIIKPKENPQYPNQIEEVIEKPSLETAPSRNAILGRFVLSHKVIDELRPRILGKDNELWLADANNELAKKDVVLNQTINNGEWMTTGDPMRWLKANIAIALNDPSMKDNLLAFLKDLVLVHEGQ
jgi:UTP--glucose-1-phosphate uridylyltransferase